MFPLIAILVVLICAVPLCLAISFLFIYSGWSVGVAASVASIIFVVVTSTIIRTLILKNAKTHV